MVIGGCGADSDSTSAPPVTRIGVTSCGSPPAAPSAFSAAVSDRRNSSFRLSWTAPATFWNGAVSGYLIRYARVPITTTNFDQATVTASYTYTGAPAAPGVADGATITGLNIETDYYFAVKACNPSGCSTYSPEATGGVP